MSNRLAIVVEQFVRIFNQRSARLGRLVGRRRTLVQLAAAAVAVTLAFGVRRSLIPILTMTPIVAQSRRAMDMIFQGCSMRVFQAKQQ